VGKYCSGEQRELMGKILIAEDDQNQADAISDVLKREFHTLEVVCDGAEAMDRLRLYHYDLAILDWEMPKYTGIQVLQQFRKNGGKVPVREQMII
jgi:DNA-binding response OmpR family regulator